MTSIESYASRPVISAVEPDGRRDERAGLQKLLLRYFPRGIQAANATTLAFSFIWLAAFCALLWSDASKPLWYDELLTYYGATATSWVRYWAGITHFDFNPPLQYILVRGCIKLLGSSPLAIRLPFILAFAGSTLVVFDHVRRRSHAAFGFLAVDIFWSTGFFSYATEARPYALVLLFASLSYDCWTRTIRQCRWSLAHLSLALSVSGLILSHCFGLVFLLPIIVGELFRSRSQGKLDGRTWVSLLTPLSLISTYVPFLRQPGRILYPWSTMARISSAAYFYLYLIFSIALPVCLLLALRLARARTKGGTRHPAVLARHEAACLIAGILAPLLPIFYSIHAGIPFAPRYGMGVIIPVTLLSLLATRRGTLSSTRTDALCALVLLGTFLIQYRSHVHSKPGPLVIQSALPSLPVVVANCGRFLEVDHFAGTELASRLFCLTDREAAIQYAHSTIFEDFELLASAYPIRGRVAAYSSFIKEHQHFLVISLPVDWPQLWLLPKLRNDQANIRLVQANPEVYEVSFDSRQSGAEKVREHS